IVEGTHRAAVKRSGCGNGFHDRNHSIGSQLVEDSEDEFTFDGETGHRFAVDDGLTCFGIEDTGQDRGTVANSADNAAAVPNVSSDCLQAFRLRIVVKGSVAG